MTPIKAFLEAEISGTFSYQKPNQITEIVNSVFAKRTTSGLEFLKEAKEEIEKYFAEDKSEMLKVMNSAIGCDDWTEIDGVEVAIECNPPIQNHPIEFSGIYKLYAKSVEIGILQFFENQTIAYHSESKPQVRFIKLDKTVTCFIVPNFWDSDSN